MGERSVGEDAGEYGESRGGKGSGEYGAWPGGVDSREEVTYTAVSSSSFYVLVGGQVEQAWEVVWVPRS